jgi:hypothetical protein
MFLSPLSPHFPAPAKTNNIHVIFSPSLFVRIQKKKGIKCIRETLESGKALPMGPAVLCRALDGVVLACDSDVLGDQGSKVRERVELLGGRFVGDQLPADTTVFCGKTALSQGF